jgi:hypothetical protein
MKDAVPSHYEAMDDGVSLGLSLARESEEKQRQHDRLVHTFRLYVDLLLIAICAIGIWALRIKLELTVVPFVLLGGCMAYLLQRIWKQDFSWLIRP